MRCPHCDEPTLGERPTKQAVVLDVCSRCHGVWLDRGMIYEFSSQPEALERSLGQGLRDRATTGHRCPRCETPLERGTLPDRDAAVEECPGCGGLWLSAGDLERALGDGGKAPVTREELDYEIDPATRDKAHTRLQDIAAGLLALPNLFLRSVLTLALLYGLLTLALITAVEFGGLNETVALVIGITIAVVQYALGPWLMDLSLRWVYKFRWVRPDELPEHLRLFVERVCEEERMKFPSFGLIDDGAPTAFTYGHVPGNARIVISRGILELLEPAEVEGVVAHEMGHAHNWDMALMTLAQLVPLLLYYIYRVGIRLGAGRGKDKQWAWAVAVGAYVLYIVSEYVVLWFSRTREYFADRFAGRVTKNPNALAMALVKIAYGLAAQPREKVVEETVKGKKKVKTEQHVVAGQGAMRALNIFDDRQAVSLVMASAVGRGTAANGPDVEHIKSAMQWDLWNPWAKLYELNSTHPLVANRLTYLADQAAHLGQEPLVVFDRRKPESYWDDFFVVGAWALQHWGGEPTRWLTAAAGAGLASAALGSLLKTNFSYRRDFFPHLSVAALMHRVKVSGVRPVPATLTGNITGKGVPGLIWSKDFVVRDATGIMFLDYQQPLAIWNFLFGLLRAGRYQGKEVRVCGWFRRAPMPYLEVYRIETTDGSQPVRRCYSMHARLIMAGVMFAAGVAVAALGVMM